MKKLATIVLTSVLTMTAAAQQELEERAKAIADRAIEYLRTQQHDSGGWSVRDEGPNFPAVTGLVITGMLLDPDINAGDTDVAEGIRQAKARSGPDMVVWGSSTLTPLLIAQVPADTVHLLVFPVLLGRGKRFFSDRADARELALVDTKTAPTGVILSTYRPVGPLRTGSFAKPPA